MVYAARLPDDFIIGIRLGVFEPTLEDALAHARWLDRHGIDFIDASYGFNFEMDPVKPEDYPLLDVHYGAGEIKKAVMCRSLPSTVLTVPKRHRRF